MPHPLSIVVRNYIHIYVYAYSKTQPPTNPTHTLLHQQIAEIWNVTCTSATNNGESDCDFFCGMLFIVCRETGSLLSRCCHASDGFIVCAYLRECVCTALVRHLNNSQTLQHYITSFWGRMQTETSQLWWPHGSFASLWPYAIRTHKKRIRRNVCTHPVQSTNSTLSPWRAFIACVADSSRLHGLSHM